MKSSSLYTVSAALAIFSFLFAAEGNASSGADPFRGKVALIAGFGPESEKAQSVRKFAEAYEYSHAEKFIFASKTRPGADRFRVLDASGKIVYEGGDDRQAEVAVVNALTDIPPPGCLVSGVQWNHFKKFRRKFEMLGTSVEGFALKPIRNGLKSKKPGVAEEAKAILDAVAKRHDGLIVEIEAAKETAPAQAYRDMMLFVKTWPSEKKRYAAAISAYADDPKVVAEYKKLIAPEKNKRR